MHEYSDYSLEDTEEQYYSDEDLNKQGVDVDLDVLPTMLVYQNGELLHNWVRVDWEAGKDGLENLLLK